MFKKYALPAIITSVLIVAFALVFSAKNNQEIRNNNSDLVSKNAIVILADRFEPSNLTITKGQVVTFINRDTDDHWPASDDHPSHQLYPQFDPRRSIKPGESWTFTFNEAGTWDFHDHIYPSMRGKVVVQN